MAGGFGTKFNVEVTSRLDDSAEIVHVYIVELLKKHGISEMVMLLYHQPDIVKNFFRDGSDFGIKIEYVTPLQDMGTAGAVKCAEKLLNERFLVISGDLLTDFNLKKIIDFHIDHHAMATITLTSVKDPLQFGVVITDKEKRITQFLEKPGWGEVISDTINTGIYVLEPEIFKYIPADENFDFSHDLFPIMLNNKDPLFGYPVKGYWRDIGNTDSYREAHHDIFHGKINIKIEEEKQDLLGKDIRLGTDVTSNLKALEGTVILGDNSQILGRSSIKDSVIGRNSTIEEGAKLFRCVIWDNVYIKKGAKLVDSLICSNVTSARGRHRRAPSSQMTPRSAKMPISRRMSSLANSSKPVPRFRKPHLGKSGKNPVRRGHDPRTHQYRTDTGIYGKTGLYLWQHPAERKFHPGRP
jgi:mannose-1-phosphate guanylyltransferase/phosphomannomutase